MNAIHNQFNVHIFSYIDELTEEEKCTDNINALASLEHISI